MPEFQDGHDDDNYSAFQLIGVIVIALLGFAVFFLSFLLAPLAILAVFYVGFAAADRNRRDGNGKGNGDGNGKGNGDDLADDHPNDGIPHDSPPLREPTTPSSIPVTRPPGAASEPRPVPPTMVTPGAAPR